MTRYYTLVATELLSKLREWSRWAEGQDSTHPLWPPGLRLVRVVEAPTPPGCELVEFEDENAPEELAGTMVTPTISIECGTGGATERTWISHRQIDTPPTPWTPAESAGVQDRTEEQG